MTSLSHEVGRKRVVLARVFLLPLRQGCDPALDTDPLYLPVLSKSYGMLRLTDNHV